MFLLVWQILFSTDYILLPFFAAAWYFALRFYRDIKYPNSILKQYFMPALMFRLLGAVLTALMYQHYYGYGDTYFYYFGARDIYNALISNPAAAIDILFVHYLDWDPATFDAITLRQFFTNKNEAMVIKIAGIASPFGLGTYIGTSFAITIFSFAGCWAMYRVFFDQYPHLHRQLAFAILYLPSMCFWSTGIMKDSIVIGGLGLFVYGIYFGFIRQEKKLAKSIFFILLGAFLMRNVKIYVLVAIIPASVIWIFFMYKERIQNETLRKFASPIFFVFGMLGGAIAIQQLGATFSQFSFEGFMEEAAKMQWWLKHSTDRDNGTGYDLGVLDPSFTGLLRAFPLAVNVALFRPYPWEASKVIVIPSALEALFTFGLTLYVFYKVGIFKIIGAILGDPVILFCLIFAIIFAFAVGFTSFNFGALARYKIPCLPFYYTAMILLLDKVPKPQVPIPESSETASNLKPNLV